jgi:hypothetical protein
MPMVKPHPISVPRLDTPTSYNIFKKGAKAFKIRVMLKKL